MNQAKLEPGQLSLFTTLDLMFGMLVMISYVSVAITCAPYGVGHLMLL
jgi:hypothetical protein